MKAIKVEKPGGPDQLKLVERDKPSFEADELLIQVKATAVNRLDTVHRQNGTGNFPYLGVEAVGVVAEAGSEAETPIGTPVMGLVKGGGYSEFAVMKDSWAMPIPEGLTFQQAAGVPEVFLTAYQTLFKIGNLQPGETVLIHAGASGVGTAAIQLAKQLVDARVIITAGSDEKIEFCKSLGADFGINYKTEDFPEKVAEYTDGRGVDLVLDFIGADYWDKNIKSLAVDGRWVLIGTLGGEEIDHINLRDLMGKRLQLTGTLLTPRSDEYKAELARDLMRDAGSAFEDGRIKPIIDQVFDLEDAADAHRYMEADKNMGKIILNVDAD